MSAITPEKAGKVSKMDPSQPNDSNEVRGADSNGSAEKSERIASSEDASHEYPKAFSLALIMVGLCLAVLLVALDNTILVTAIPKITDAFQSINDIGWYGSAYLLTTCSLQLFYGKLYTLFSIKVVFMGAISIFELGSLICGIATTSTVLIVGRAVAGSGAAGILSGSMIIIAHNVPLQQRPVYTGATMGMYGIASVVGPLLGGILTDHVSWRWCFYINLPIGGAVLLVVGFFLSTPIRRQQETLTWGARLWTLDPLGMVFFIPSIICLLLALQLGGSTYAWSNARIIALFIVFGLLLLAFIVVQIWLGEIATIPIRILKNRSIISALWYGFFLGASFFIFIYYLPTWFQAIQSVRATASGLHLLPITISQLLGVIISGALTTLFGYYTPFMVLGTVFMSVGGGLLMKLDVQSPARAWIGYQVIYGLGAGFGFQQPTLAAQTVLDLKDVPVGVATAMFSQLLGGALFVSVGQNVFSNKLLSSAAKELPGIDLGKLIKTGATELVHLVPESQLEKLLEVYNGALQQAFMVGLILSVMTVVGAITMQWRSMKNKDETTSA